MKKINYQQIKRIISVLLIVIMLLGITLISPDGSYAKTMNVLFTESLSISQSKTVAITNLKSVNSATVNTGTVSYSVSGENVTMNVTGGVATGSQWDNQKYNKVANQTVTQSTNSFTSTIPYSDADGYSGTLAFGSVTSENYCQIKERYEEYESCTTTDVYEWVWNGHLCGWLDEQGGVGKRCKVKVGETTTCTTVGEWVEYCVWKDRYYGSYSGTVYKGGNVPLYSYSVTLDYTDNSAPTISLANPTNNSSYTNGGTIQINGTTRDVDVGEQQSIHYSLVREGTNLINHTNVLIKSFASDGTHQSFEKTLSIGADIPEGRYLLKVRVTDSNSEFAEITRNIIVDKSPPNAPAIVANATWTNAASVPVTISHGADALAGVWFTEYNLTGATITSAWTHYDSGFSISNEGVTMIQARTIDIFGMISNVSSKAVKIDRTLPAGGVIINNNADYTSSKTVSLSISATDDASGVSLMQFRNGTGVWSSPEAFNTTKIWTLEGADGVKNVSVRILDLAGNASVEASDAIILDSTPPTLSSFSIENGKPYHNSAAVTLNFGITDNLTGVKSVMVSNDGTNWTLRDFEVAIPWTLSAGEGAKTVYAKAVDMAGNATSAISDTIFIDTINPLGDIKINNGDITAASRDVKLTLTFGDNVGGSGVSIVKIIENETEYVFPNVPNSPNELDWRLSAGSGLKTVTLVIVDRAGNMSSVSASITVDQLALNHFKLTDVINPIAFNEKTPFVPLTWAFPSQPMLSGANITFEAMLKKAYNPSWVSDSISYKVDVVFGEYHKVYYGDMAFTTNDTYVKTITLPEDAPKGAKVFVSATAKRQLLVSPFDLQTIYFPGVEASNSAQIGEIKGNIHEILKFNETN